MSDETVRVPKAFYENLIREREELLSALESSSVRITVYANDAYLIKIGGSFAQITDRDLVDQIKYAVEFGKKEARRIRKERIDEKN